MFEEKWAEPQNSVGQYKYINIYVIAVSERGTRMVNTTPKIWFKKLIYRFKELSKSQDG